VNGLLFRLAKALQNQAPQEIPEYSKPSCPDSFEYPIWRLRHAWTQGNAFGADEAVLVRQAVRWAGGQILAPQLPERVRDALNTVSAYCDDAGRLACQPFLPRWLDPTGINLDDGIDPLPVRRVPNEAVPAEAYVTDSFGYTHWKSQALKEACWEAFEAPPGSTVLVALPTGSGKSLCFHFLARFSSGLTLVVVPTVALAIDQYCAARQLPLLGHLDVRYFAADDPDFNAKQVVDAVRSGATRLLFASPEACVSGRLRPVLDELASQGRLDNVVIDEAHMVGTWGIYFRVDFQLLSTVWQNWRKRSKQSIRTLLLSATFTPECREGLKRLFPSEVWMEFVSQRLRPEISYYLKQFDNGAERDQSVIECVRHLPRPSILYTTSVKDAKLWYDRLLSEGFCRVGCFTGDTPRAERRSLLDRWRTDAIDMMVATSAFGLGVDKPDVRSIVHACIPEDLDRFYQEVGRAGRDGYSAISVLLATKKDYYVASGLGPTLLRPQTVQERWQSLWRTRECIDEEHHRYRVNVQTKKDELTGTRTYEENVRWNKRLLLQLLRAGKLILLDLKDAATADEDAEWITLELRFPPESPDICSLIAPVRQQELELLQRGLERMLACLSGHDRVCSVLHQLYGKGTVRECGGCPGCRGLRRAPGETRQLLVPTDITATPSVHVVMNMPPMFHHNESGSLARWLRRARQVKGLNRFACTDHFFPKLVEACREAFGGNPQPYRVDLLGLDAPGWEPSFRLGPDDNMIALHGDRVHRGVFDMHRGHVVTHWICDGCDPVDERGKRWADHKGVRPYVTPEAWIASGGNRVY